MVVKPLFHQHLNSVICVINTEINTVLVCTYLCYQHRIYLPCLFSLNMDVLKSLIMIHFGCVAEL